MPLTWPTVPHLIEALQLADALVRRQFRVVGAALRLGPSRADDLGSPDWAQNPALPRPTPIFGACAAGATLLLA